jgi:DnaK suppressor protein
LRPEPQPEALQNKHRVYRAGSPCWGFDEEDLPSVAGGRVNKAELEKLKDKLLLLKVQSEQDEKESIDTAGSIELDQTSVGRLSRMDALQNHQIALAASRQRQHQLQKVDGALRRITSGHFGECFVCGNKISMRRLDIDPTITRCTTCID